MISWWPASGVSNDFHGDVVTKKRWEKPTIIDTPILQSQSWHQGINVVIVNPQAEHG